jgi:hypothetical protein
MGHMGLSHMGLNILQHPPAVWTTGAAEFKTEQERKHVRAQHTRPPPQPQLATGDVEARAKLGEGRGREAFGEDIRKLGGGRDVKHSDVADGHPVADEV